MSDVNANINISINSKQALAQLRSLQNQISDFNRSVIASNVAAAQQQKALTAQLIATTSAAGTFSTSITNVESSVSRLDKAIAKNKLSLGQYFRYATAASGTFGRGMKEHAEIMDLAADRVKRLQTQYVALGNAQNGMTRALAMRPLQLHNADAAIGIQRQQIFNKLMHDGSTAMVNWGKNTQWAGRQLMVGFTVPLTIFGGVAGKIFMDLEKQVVQFKRVYGDLQTTPIEKAGMVEQVKELGKEFTKYGIAVNDTIALAAKAAATGATGADLIAQTTEATRLATLGQIDYQQALDATISLQTAFGISSKELAETTDFLNAVENQTVTSLDDITSAIPLVAPVIKGLGGDVKDLAIFMTAMREGGVSANEGANALKSGLASLINPTKAAREQLEKVGINIDEILSTNKGDLRGLVTEFGDALGQLDKFSRQQTLAKMFGKYQFARLGALFQNISKDGTQASRVIDLTTESAKNLADLSEGELSQLEEAVGVKFTAAVERLKLAIAPIGESFLKIATPIIDFATMLADKFNSLPDGMKSIITWGVAIGGVVIPAVVMIVGLLANFVGQMVKMGNTFRMFMQKIRGGGSALQYLESEELDAMAAAASLEGQTNSLTGALNVQRSAVNNLARSYGAYTAAANAAAGALPQGFRAGRGARKYATGGFVAGSGNKDTEPALLTPGEFVVNKKAATKHAALLDAMNSGNLKGYATGSPRRSVATYGETMARMQYGPENERGLASVPSVADIMAILAPRVGEGRNIPITPRTVGAGAFDDIASMLNPLVTEFVSKVQNHFDTTFAGIADTNERLNQAWLQAGRETEQAIQMLPEETDRVVVERMAGLREDVYNTIPTAASTPGGALDKERGPLYSKTKDNVMSYTKIRPAFKAMWSRLTGGDASQLQVGHVGKSKMTDLDEALQDPKVSGSARRAATNFGAGAADSVGEGAGTNSPSKITQQQGKDVAKGLEIGIEQGTPSAVAAAESLGSQVANAADPQTASGRRRRGATRPQGPAGRYGANGVLLEAVPQNPTGNGLTGNYTPATMPTSNPTRDDLGIPVKETRGLKEKLTGMSGKLGAGMLAMDGLVFGMSMMDNGVGEFAQKIMPAVFGLQGLQMMLPMLMNPIGATIAALVAVGAGMWFLNKQTTDLANKGKQLADAMYGTTKNMEDTADFFGRKTWEDKVASQRAEAAGGGPITSENTQMAKDYVGSDAGKTLLENIRVAMDTLGSDQAAKALQNNLQRMMLSGAIAPEMGSAIASQIGEQLGNQQIAFDAISNMNKIVGPDGKNLLNQDGRMRIVADITGDPTSLVDSFEQAGMLWDGATWFTQATMVVKGEGTQDLFAASAVEEAVNKLNIYQQEIDRLTSKWQAGKISAEKYQESMNKIFADKAGALSYQKMMEDAAFAFGDAWDAGAQDKLGQGLADELMEFVKSTSGLGEQAGTEFLEGLKMTVDYGQWKDKINLLDPENVRETVENLKAQGKNAEAAKVQENFDAVMNLSLKVQSGEIDGATIQKMIDNGIEPIDILAKLSVKYDNPEATAIMQMATGNLKPDSVVLEVITDFIESGNTGAARALLDKALRGQKVGVDYDVEMRLRGDAGLIDKVEEFDALAAKKKTPVNRLVKFASNNFGMVKGQIDGWAKLSDHEKKTRTMVWAQAYLTAREEFVGSGALDRMKREMGAAGAASGDEYLVNQHATNAANAAANESGSSSTTLDPEGTSPSGGNSGGGTKEDPLKGYKDMWKGLMDTLKMYTNIEKVLDKVGKKKNALEKALKNGALGFNNSLAQQMRDRGLSEAFIADLLSKGYTEAKKIFETLKKRDKLAVANRAMLIGGAGETISNNRKSIREKQAQLGAFDKLNGNVSSEVRDSISGDPEKAQQYLRLWKDVQNGVAGADKRLAQFVRSETLAVEKAKELEEATQTVAEAWKSASDVIMEAIDLEIQKIEDRNAKEFAANHGGLTPEDLEQAIETRNAEIAVLEHLVKKVEDLNEADEKRISDLNRQKEMIQRSIDQLERANELDQRRIENLRREDELLQRQADAINRELELMARQEEVVRNAYQARIDSLNEIAKINDHILQSQQSQLNIGKALSEGDVYAAAQAAAEMQSQQVQYANQVQQDGLQQGMENAVNGLTTASGMTREQAEARLNAIKDQSYATSLQIRDIEDQIYARTQQMIPLKDQQYQLDLQIRDINDIIYNRNLETKDVYQQQIDALAAKNEQAEYELAVLDAKNQKDTEAMEAKQAALAREIELQHNSFTQVTNIRDMTDSARKKADELAASWGSVANEAWRAAQNSAAAGAGTGSVRKYAGGMIKKYAAGAVVGDGARDSVAALLTPGEFVVRKAMVDKYGEAMFQSINQGSFAMPKYGSVGSVGSLSPSSANSATNVSAPVYNNTYSVNVNASTNASADDIARTVIAKIKTIESSNIRRINGY